MRPAQTLDFSLPCRSGWCMARALALIALWLALVAGFLAATTVPSPARYGLAVSAPAEASSPS